MALTFCAAWAASQACAQETGGGALVAALQQGGYVVVMRHAHAPEAPPSAAEADRSNLAHERQLDAAGRASASAMRGALRALRVPVGTVWSSPTYRARETARLAGFRRVKIAAELGDNGRSMQATNDAQATWLRAHANDKPRSGKDTIIVTQFPNISAAFGDAAAGMKDGDALVFRPGGMAPLVIGRIGIEQWPVLAGQLNREERHHGA